MIDDGTDFEHPSPELKKLFKEEGKIVDDEAKSLNIIVKEFPSSKEAIKEFDELVKNFTIDSFREKLTEFDNKFSTLNPYISVNATYDVEGSSYGYRACFDYEDFSPEKLQEYKDMPLTNTKMTWKYLEVVLKVDGDREHYRYNISI